MTPTSPQPVNRRGFFAHVARGAVALAVGVGVGALIRRPPVSVARGETCVNPQPRSGCRSCAILSRCGLPQALSLKRQTRSTPET